MPTPPIKILIVDDNATNCFFLARALNGQGRITTIAENGQQALEKLATETFDLMLLDIMMPRMNGYEVLEKTRERFSSIELPVILVTSINQRADVIKGLRYGANDYITKPVDLPVLLARVEIQLRLKAAERELNKKNEMVLQAQRHMLHQEKMAALGNMVAGVAHEMMNPLNFINNFAGMTVDLVKEFIAMEANEAEHDKETRADLLEQIQTNGELILKHGDRAARIVQRMTSLATEGTARGEEHLAELVHDNLSLVKQNRPTSTIEFLEAYDPELPPIWLETANIGRVIISMLGNAIDAVETRAKQADESYKPQIRVATGRKDNEAVIRIEDNGAGIPEAIIHKIFEPFFTTKIATEANNGLGLSFCYAVIVGNHHGRIDVRSQEGDYTHFILYLPMDQTQKKTAAATIPSSD